MLLPDSGSSYVGTSNSPNSQLWFRLCNLCWCRFIWVYNGAVRPSCFKPSHEVDINVYLKDEVNVCVLLPLYV